MHQAWASRQLTPFCREWFWNLKKTCLKTCLPKHTHDPKRGFHWWFMVFDLQDLARQNFAAKEFASQASTSAEQAEGTAADEQVTTTWGSFAALGCFWIWGRRTCFWKGRDHRDAFAAVTTFIPWSYVFCLYFFLHRLLTWLEELTAGTSGMCWQLANSSRTQFPSEWTMIWKETSSPKVSPVRIWFPVQVRRIEVSGGNQWEVTHSFRVSFALPRRSRAGKCLQDDLQ